MNYSQHPYFLSLSVQIWSIDKNILLIGIWQKYEDLMLIAHNFNESNYALSLQVNWSLEI